MEVILKKLLNHYSKYMENQPLQERSDFDSVFSTYLNAANMSEIKSPLFNKLVDLAGTPEQQKKILDLARLNIPTPGYVEMLERKFANRNNPHQELPNQAA
jgi:hypothetical protein